MKTNHTKNEYSTLKYGEPVKVKCTATGRYLGNGKALYVGAMSNYLIVDDIAKPIRKGNPHNLPMPSDEDLARHTKNEPTPDLVSIDDTKRTKDEQSGVRGIVEELKKLAISDFVQRFNKSSKFKMPTVEEIDDWWIEKVTQTLTHLQEQHKSELEQRMQEAHDLGVRVTKEAYEEKLQKAREEERKRIGEILWPRLEYSKDLDRYVVRRNIIAEALSPLSDHASRK